MNDEDKMKWIHLMDAIREQIQKWLEEGSSPETIRTIFELTIKQIVQSEGKTMNNDIVEPLEYCPKCGCISLSRWYPNFIGTEARWCTNLDCFYIEHRQDEEEQ
jgi:hypothetical protein